MFYKAHINMCWFVHAKLQLLNMRSLVMENHAESIRDKQNIVLF